MNIGENGEGASAVQDAPFRQGRLFFVCLFFFVFFTLWGYLRFSLRNFVEM